MVFEAQQVYIYPSMRVKTPENGKKRPFWEVFRKFPGQAYPKSKKMGGGHAPPPFGQTPHEALAKGTALHELQPFRYFLSRLSLVQYQARKKIHLQW